MPPNTESAARTGTVANVRDTEGPLDPRAPHLATGEVVAAFGSEVAQRLYAAFQAFNTRFFAGKLAPPLVLITQPSSSRTLGDYIARDEHGLESRIRIAPAVVKRGELFALDVLLHEMVHACMAELEGAEEHGYRGHGPRFAAQCNRIGAELGLPPVGVKKRGGLPDCAHWPLNVRPEGYYPEPYEPPSRRKPTGDSGGDARDEEGGEAGNRGDRDDKLAAVLRALPSLDAEGLRAVADALAVLGERED